MSFSVDDALALHRAVPVMDMHADTPLLMRRGYDFLKMHRPWTPNGALFGHVDEPRMRAAEMTAQMFGIVTLPYLQRQLLHEAFLQVACVEEMVSRSQGRVRFARGSEDVLRARTENATAVVLSLEGLHLLDDGTPDDALASLKALCARGVKSVGLVHFSRNRVASPGLGKGSEQSGLSEFGRTVIHKLQEWGCLIDLAHISRTGFDDAMSVLNRPPIVSHCGLRAFLDSKRNIDDDQIRAVADRGGVMGIMYARPFLGSGDLSRVVDEFKHLVDVGGEDCAALGSDFDGLVYPPRGLPDVKSLPVLTAALMNALGERITAKILGGNFLRVLDSASGTVPP